MSSIHLFTIKDKVSHLSGSTVLLESSLQRLIEENMETFFEVTFLASEYSTGPVHGGRIDSLGLDDTNCPVIFEYKRSLNDNVISQGLYYLDWLLDHKAEFELLVLKRLGKERSDQIDWNGSRLICIAGDFTKFDEHAVKQINRNIELIRYIKYGDELVLFEMVNKMTARLTSTGATSGNGNAKPIKSAAATTYKTVDQYLDQSPPELKELFAELSDYCQSLGDDVSLKTGKNQFLFKRYSNFVCAEIHPRDNELVIYLRIDPSSIEIEKGFTRDMRGTGHWGTGDLEVRIRERKQLEAAKPLIQASYNNS